MWNAQLSESEIKYYLSIYLSIMIDLGLILLVIVTELDDQGDIPMLVYHS